MKMWEACGKGCPNRYDCPDQPPESERCPEYRSIVPSGDPEDGYYRCKVIGPHEVHNDGHGIRWLPLPACAFCGEPVEDPGYINQQPHHRDRCYEDALWRRGLTRYPPKVGILALVDEEDDE